MPFKNKGALGQNNSMMQQTLESLGNTPDLYTTKTLMYQDFPIEVNQEAICNNKMKDCYWIAKGKLSGKHSLDKKHAIPHDPTEPLDQIHQLANAEYDYELSLIHI